MTLPRHGREKNSDILTVSKEQAEVCKRNCLEASAAERSEANPTYSIIASVRRVPELLAAGSGRILSQEPTLLKMDNWWLDARLN